MGGDRLKTDKKEMNKASDVTGREHKGLAGAGVLGKIGDVAKKIVPDSDKTGSALKSEGWMHDPK